MKTLTLTLLLALSASLAPQATAQRVNNERYDEPSRFPVLRKAFRQIRNDLRYHAGAIRDTASDIRHDVSSSIRGETSPREQSPSPSYGYRGQPVPNHGTDYYQEPAAPTPRRQVEQRLPVSNERKTEVEPGPTIVAPREKVKRQPTPTPTERIDPPVEEKPTPTPELKNIPAPKPKIEPEQKPESKPDKKEPAVGKIHYPDAKRSNRPGFHYSPFPPYELLDTQGIGPGELAKDPGNSKIFRVPK
ncbi:MAG: hypothetical protein ACI8XO_001458 [Verrucomicrobiales bacterium]|jgi:hypothetical protein